MEILKGIGVSPGVAICPAVIIDAEDYRIPHRTVPPEQVGTEVRRVRRAFLDATEELSGLQVSRGDLWDGRIKDIFAVHLHFLKDRTMRKKITELIREKSYIAEYAVTIIMRDLARHFSQVQDSYMAERASDIYDIERRLLRQLIGRRREEFSNQTEPVVVVAHDLTPTQTIAFDRAIVKGIATDAGGRTSHTAIVARSMSIPAVVALENVTGMVNPGDTIIIDGNRGTVVVDPDEQTLQDYQRFAAQIVEHAQELDELVGLAAVTKDDVRIQLLGNIEFPSEAGLILKKGGDGIGLYRTEFLFLDSGSEPTEEDHFQAYIDTIKTFGERVPITIRTFDLGADKFTQGKNTAPERNPFLGLRSIRYCLQNLPMFKRQMRAILRASAHGTIKIMFPLITSLLELRQAKWILAEVKEDLEEQDIPFDENMQIGIMVETPAAALIAEELADEVDFFSIGTNDLIQYTLAVDRVNEKVASLYSPAHPAVLNLINHVVKTANRAKIDVSLCGEMASETEYTTLLLGIGVTTLSLSPPMIPEVKKIIRSVSLDHCRQIARKVLQLDTDTQVINVLREDLRCILEQEV